MIILPGEVLFRMPTRDTTKIFKKDLNSLVAKYRRGLSDSQKQIVINKKAYAINSIVNSFPAYF